jgi:hypothetical protein
MTFVAGAASIQLLNGAAQRDLWTVNQARVLINTQPGIN